jgi:hypothetical protein
MQIDFEMKFRIATKEPVFRPKSYGEVPNALVGMCSRCIFLFRRNSVEVMHSIAVRIEKEC